MVQDQRKNFKIKRAGAAGLAPTQPDKWVFDIYARLRGNHADFTFISSSQSYPRRDPAPSYLGNAPLGGGMATPFKRVVFEGILMIESSEVNSRKGYTKKEKDKLWVYPDLDILPRHNLSLLKKKKFRYLNLFDFEHLFIFAAIRI